VTNAHNPKRRFGMTLSEAIGSGRFNPSLANAPPLPVVEFSLLGKTAPTPANTPAGQLPRATAVVISWTDAEWAALQHVFCGGAAAMDYSARLQGAWPDWRVCSFNLPSGAPQGWNNWGSYRLVEVDGAPVLLWKSNTHLDFPGVSYLEAMIQLLIEYVKPQLILSVGTAGGAQPQDHVGTVRAVSGGTLFEPDQPQSAWPVYRNDWIAPDAVLSDANFRRVLSPVPATATAIASLCAEFNQYYGSHYTPQDLDPDGLNTADPSPAIDDQTGGAVTLLTTPTFVVATTAGNLDAFSSVEMDDAIIGKTCAAAGTSFAFVRNLSDPAQPAALPAKVQGDWGSAVYDVFGFYTSYNGALTAWAMLN
jgi:hypothetical protein